MNKLKHQSIHSNILFDSIKYWCVTYILRQYLCLTRKLEICVKYTVNDVKPLSCISSLSYLCSHVMVTTHALRLMSLSSNNLHYSKTLIDPSDKLRLIFGTSFQHHSNSSSKFPVPSKRPSFEHTGLTCYTLLSHSITFSLFHSELKDYLFRKSYRPVCLFLLD